VAVTHDRYFLDSVAGYILEVDNGSLFPFVGNYSGWLKQKAARTKLEERAGEARAARMQSELEWIRGQGNRGVQKARLRSYEKLVSEVESARHAERVQSGAISIVAGPRLGNLVLRASGLSKSFGDRELFRGLSFELPAGAVLGIVGPNGSGKSTLVRIVSGEEEADSGELRMGDTVELGYVNQNRDGLDPEKTVYEEIAQGVETLVMGGREVNMRAYVAAFNLRGLMQEKRVASLSGGERGRVHLAKTLRAGCNLLILDEPSNDLDIETLRSLEEALFDFAGSAIVVSHDRWFLDRVCDHTLAFEPHGVEFFEGGVSAYYAWRDGQRQRLPDAAPAA